MLTLWRNDTTIPTLLAEMNRLARDVADEPSLNDHGLRPAADVVETQGGFEVTLDMPGVDPKAIQIQVEEQTLTVQAARRQVASPKDGAVHRSERPTGTFSRSFALPGSVDSSRVEARYEEGVLSVTLPKREEAKPRTIQVKVA